MATQNIFNLTDTWNNVATTFTAIKMNATDTASAAGSLLIDLQVGGTSQFKVSKAGAGTFAAGLTVGTNITMGSNNQLSGAGASTLSSPTNGTWRMTNNAGTDFTRLQFGGTTNSFGAVARDGAGISIVGGAGGSTAHIKVPGVTVANLPAAATAGVGARSFVTDALAPVFGSAVTGGGAVNVPVYSTGAAWNVG